jgi:allantoate deiminase
MSVAVPRGTAAAARVLARADELAALSRMPGGIDRRYLTPEHRAANAMTAGWLEDAGLEAWQDAAGNQCGRVPGAPDDAPVVLLGSHLDSVPDAGRYDGILGVLIALEVAERLRDEAAALPFALEFIGFADEEGTRFGATLLGSRAVAGTWEPSWAELRDEDGITLREAARGFGLDPDRIGDASRAGEIHAYLEAHIEQGPRLERADRALGVVTGIAAAERRLLVLTGETRHGATPWDLRHDALLGFAEADLAIERIVRESGAYATVGHVAVEPDAVNVIPGVAEFSLDLRDETAAGRDAAWELVHAELQRLADRRGLRLDALSTHRADACTADPGLRAAIAAGVAATGDADPLELFSIAGHDAMAIAAAAPVAMLFVRCAGGISHAPEESVRADDVALAIDALEAAVRELARR